MKNGRAFFLLLMGMIATLYTAFVVIGQDDAAPVDADAPAEAAPAEAGADIADEPEAAPAEVADDAVVAPAEVADDAVVAPAEVAEEEAPAEDVVEVVEEAVVPEDGSESVFVAVEGDDGDIPGANAEKEDEEGTISISLDDVEMADVVRMFTRISDANIIASPSNLVGRVTANLDDVNWQSAMVTILDMHNLSLTESPPGSKIFRIDPKLPGAPEPMKVQTFFLKYAAVSNSSTVISAMLVPGATLQPFASRNALVVRSTASNIGEIQEVIDAIDVLRDQVFIEAKFMELNDSAIKDLGINWQVLQGYSVGVENMNWGVSEDRDWAQSRADATTRSDARAYNDSLEEQYDMDGVQYQESTTTYEEAPPGSGVYVPTTAMTPTRSVTDTIDKTQDVTSDISDSFSKAITDVRTAVLGVDDFRLVLSALKQMDGVQVVSNPKIIVANEESAVIHIGESWSAIKSVVTPATQVEASKIQYEEGRLMQLGVLLTVTPTINTESNITVRIEPELNRFVRNNYAPDGSEFPVVSKKTIKTMFCLESGKTVAIGGLTESTEFEAVKKIPLLGDIPLIGKYLFSHSHTEKRQTETIIFVTVGLAQPGAVTELDGIPEDTELAHRRLLKDRLKRHEFKQQLENDRQKIEEKLQEAERVRSHLLKSK